MTNQKSSTASNCPLYSDYLHLPPARSHNTNDVIKLCLKLDKIYVNIVNVYDETLRRKYV